VVGDFIVDGSFNFNEVIQNITTVNNEVVLSTQLDISNQGTGPALKVSQFGVGDDQEVAVFNAGDEGDAFKIDSSGNSHFYKEVDIVKEYDDASFDTILIRRTDDFGRRISLRTLQVYVNNINILPSATNSSTSTQNGPIGDVIEFITWNDLVVRESEGNDLYASNIRLNIVSTDITLSSPEKPYNSFNISEVQSFVLYQRNTNSNAYRSFMNGFKIELYNRFNGFTPGSNVLYTMAINTTERAYRYDLPAISSYSFGFSLTDSQTQIKTITVSNSDENVNATLLKVEGGNSEFGGGLSVTGATILSSLSVSGNQTVGGTISVTGVTTLTGNVGIGGASGTENLLVTGTGRITGNTSIGGTLSVPGANATSLGETLGVTGATTLGSTLAVTGATNFDGRLTSKRWL
jgi:hypothetical protein